MPAPGDCAVSAVGATDEPVSAPERRTDRTAIAAENDGLDFVERASRRFGREAYHMAGGTRPTQACPAELAGLEDPQTVIPWYVMRCVSSGSPELSRDLHADRTRCAADVIDRRKRRAGVKRGAA